MMLKPNWKATRNKMVSLLLTFVMLFSVFPTAAFAAPMDAVSYQIGEAVYAKLSGEGVLTLFGEGDTYDYSQGALAPWYADRARITAVQIQYGITSLGDYLFYNCENLAGQLVLPASLTRIGERAFSGSSVAAAPKLRAIVNEFTGAELVPDSEPATDEPVSDGECTTKPAADPVFPAQEEPLASEEPSEQPIEEPAAQDPATEENAPELPAESTTEEDDPGQTEQDEILSAEPATPLPNTPVESIEGGNGEIQPTTENEAPAETVAQPEPPVEDANVASKESETEVITEQILGNHEKYGVCIYRRADGAI